jgi:hypothetical protein
MTDEATPPSWGVSGWFSLDSVPGLALRTIGWVMLFGLQIRRFCFANASARQTRTNKPIID